MRLAAGLVIALAVAASYAGAGVIAAGAVAALLAFGSALPPGEPLSPDRRTAAVSTISQLSLAAVSATAFGAYAFPEYPRYAAAALLVVAVALATLGVRLPGSVTRAVTGVLALGGVLLLAVSFGIEPVNTTPPQGATVAGFALAVAALYPAFTTARGPRPVVRSLVTAVFGLAIIVGAVYQLGAGRLGLSLTSMKDLVTAADAARFTTALLLFVVLATVTATLDTVAELPAGRETWAWTVAAVAVVVAGGPVVTLVLATLAGLGEAVLRYRAHRG
ncbi:hypothetical protein [Amycolatopsis xylanica]|uniref:hypothetical protein n=1 Tax=Amycolatopsis xylanica TaxID=589385 RepID=UPI000B89CBA1|nr:hypothetical protein [Amycolatopsis xylanica]